MPSFSKRIKSLEGVRGMAAIMVYFSHFAVMFYPAFYWSDKNISHCGGVDLLIGQTPFSFLLNGNSGVMIFLILTGIGTYMMRGGGRKKSYSTIYKVVGYSFIFIFACLYIISVEFNILSADRKYTIDAMV